MSFRQELCNVRISTPSITICLPKKEEMLFLLRKSETHSSILAFPHDTYKAKKHVSIHITDVISADIPLYGRSHVVKFLSEKSVSFIIKVLVLFFICVMTV